MHKTDINMLEIKIKINNISKIKAAFVKAPAHMTKNLSEAIKQTIFFIKGDSQRRAPVRTGRLRGSAETSFSPLRGEVQYKTDYALYVHEGTSPYTIRPKSKQALFWKGAAHPVAKVNHPGIKANPFLRRSVEASGNQIDSFFEKAVEKTLEEIAKETQ